MVNVQRLPKYCDLAYWTSTAGLGKKKLYFSDLRLVQAHKGEEELDYPKLVMYTFVRCCGKGKGKETLTVTKDAEKE